MARSQESSPRFWAVALSRGVGIVDVDVDVMGMVFAFRDP